ncbi:MAG: hypothetical protein ACXVB9_04870 [Bdellovibrionota bacterium]
MRGKKHVSGWRVIILAGVLVPNFALASKGSSDACEMQTRAKFKKLAVEAEMASIAGNLSDIEVTSERESLKKRLEKEKAHCIRLVSSHKYAADSSTVTF